jgi:hypothetical protein
MLGLQQWNSAFQREQMRAANSYWFVVVVTLGLSALGSCESAPFGQDQSLPGFPAGTTPAGCTPLVVSDSTVSTEGIQLFWPAEKTNNPKAQDAKYVYLDAGREGVVLLGPNVPDTAGAFALQSQFIGLMSSSEDPYALPPGYRVFINHDFGYMVSINDFEEEVSLARVDLCQQNGSFTSQFVFVANAGARGVAQDITITAVAHSTAISEPTSPVTVEVR